MRISEPYCIKCGGPMDGKCARCRSKLTFDRARGAFIYEGVVRDLISLFKYGGQRNLSGLFIPPLLDVLEELGRPDMIVPVPLHPAKKRKRGYSQTEILAKGLSELSGIPLRKLLIRRKNTRPQVLLSPDERKINVKKAFVVRKSSDIKGKRVLLTDDVMTTGYTLSEAAKTLKSKGASRVYAVVVAIGTL